MINVRTKQIRNLWHTFMTFEGYDLSEDGPTWEESQRRMRCIIAQNKWDWGKFKFLQPEPYVWQEREKNVPYKKPWIDHNPLG